jgi:hypothetical protein
MFDYFDNNHSVNVGNKKAARDDPGMKNKMFASNKPGMI